jgi:transcriptional regulator with XRE-family HTH domain
MAQLSLRNKNAKLLKSVGLRINRGLFEKHLRVEDLSADTGVARSTICEIIAGRSNPRFLTLNSIARALGYKGLHELLRDVQS